MNEIPFHAAANITRDPELRFTSTGQPVANLGIAITPRRRDNEKNEWVDGTTTFLDATVWGDQATHVADSLTKGDRVVVLGQLVTRTWTPESGANEGKEQRRVEVLVNEIGPSLRWAKAQPEKVATTGDRAPATDEPPF